MIHKKWRLELPNSVRRLICPFFPKKPTFGPKCPKKCPKSPIFGPKSPFFAQFSVPKVLFLVRKVQFLVRNDLKYCPKCPICPNIHTGAQSALMSHSDPISCLMSHVDSILALCHSISHFDSHRDSSYIYLEETLILDGGDDSLRLAHPKISNKKICILPRYFTTLFSLHHLLHPDIYLLAPNPLSGDTGARFCLMPLLVTHCYPKWQRPSSSHLRDFVKNNLEFAMSISDIMQ